MIRVSGGEHGQDEAKFTASGHEDCIYGATLIPGGT